VNWSTGCRFIPFSHSRPSLSTIDPMGQPVFFSNSSSTVSSSSCSVGSVRHSAAVKQDRIVKLAIALCACQFVT
jgi:hypothetical protein